VDPSDDRLWKLIRAIRVAMVTTRGADGAMRSRPLATQNGSLDGASPVLWFFVSRASEVAAEAANDASVNVAYADTDEDRYVSIAGTAEVIQDRARVEALWSAAAKAWFPGGVDDPDLQLLRVQVEQAEYWDVKESKMVQLFRIARAGSTGGPSRGTGQSRNPR
jgi:general stress protein 26